MIVDLFVSEHHKHHTRINQRKKERVGEDLKETRQREKPHKNKDVVMMKNELSCERMKLKERRQERRVKEMKKEKKRKEKGKKERRREKEHTRRKREPHHKHEGLIVKTKGESLNKT